MFPRPRRRAPSYVALLVLALHLILVVVWLQPGMHARAIPDGPVLILRLLPARAPTAQPTTALQRPAPSAARQPPPPALDAPADPALQAITLPPAASAPVTPPPPLVLDLRRGASAPQRWRNPALEDPRSNRLPQTLESRLQQAMPAPSAETTERLDEFRARIRKGGDCVEVHTARGAQLDPFNQSVLPTPKQVKGC